MRIETRQFGVMDIDEEQIYTMPTGMPGFPGTKRFVIIERQEIWPFCCYQCLDEPELSFYIMNPHLFEANYHVDLPYAAKEIGWEEEITDIGVYVIVNTSAGIPDKITANLMGPLLVHAKRREAVQFVLHEGKYSHQTPVFKEISDAETHTPKSNAL